MTGSNHQSVYDLDLFGRDDASDTNSRTKAKKPKDKIKSEKDGKKRKTSITGKKGKKSRKKLTGRQNNIINIFLAAVLALITIIMVITVIMQQVELTEINQNINDAKDVLAEKQSIYTQLEMKVDANLSTSVIEKYAQEKLSMTKASNSQKEFINLSQGDKAEVTVEAKSNIFTTIAEAFSNLW